MRAPQPVSDLHSRSFLTSQTSIVGQIDVSDFLGRRLNSETFI